MVQLTRGYAEYAVNRAAAKDYKDVIAAMGGDNAARQRLTDRYTIDATKDLAALNSLSVELFGRMGNNERRTDKDALDQILTGKDIFGDATI